MGLGAPIWRNLPGGVLVAESGLCLCVPGSTEVFSLLGSEGVYRPSVGYQFLLGSVVGKVVLEPEEGAEDIYTLSGDPLRLYSDNGMFCIGDFEAMRKWSSSGELLDLCRTACSTNEQAGLIKGKAVASTMCRRPDIAVYRRIHEDGKVSYMVDLSEGL